MRTPGLAIAAVASLALGIGGTTTFFAVFDHLLLESLPVPAAHQLAVLGNEQDPIAPVSFPVWQQVQARAHLYRSAFAWTNAPVNVAPAGEVDVAQAIFASGDAFDTLAIAPALGRLIEARDDALNGGPDGLVAVLNHGYWMRRFGGAPDAIGRTITVEGVPFTVVGVTAPSLHGFSIGRIFDLVLPLRTEPKVRREFSLVDNSRIDFLRVLMRLEAAIPAEAVGAALRADQPAIRAATLSAMRRPEDRDAHLKVPFAVKPAPDGGIQGVRYYGDAARLLFALGCLVLLACCGNISTVLLAHGASRHGELSVRMALGASRWHAAGHLLAESLLLAVPGTVAGLALSVGAGPLLLAQLNDSGLDLAMNLGGNWRIWASAVAAGFTAALLCGAGAAWRAARAAPAVLLTVGHSKNAAAGGAHFVLVAGQLAFSVAVIVTGALLLRSYQAIASHPALEQLDGVLVTELRFARSNVPPLAREDAANRIRDALSAVPGVVASLAMNSPFVGGTYMWAVVPSGAPALSLSERMFTIDAVSPDQFRTLGMRLVTGRLLDDGDRPGAPLEGVVNRSFARQFLGSESRVPQALLVDTGADLPQPVDVVGVVDDMPYESLLQPIRPAMFLSRAQRIPDSSRAFLVLRPPPGRRISSTDIAAAIDAAEPRLSFVVTSLADAGRSQYARERMLALVAAFFVGIAVLIAGLGIYGVMSYTVTARWRELGIRLALGARPQRVRRLVVVQAVRLTGAGALIGLVGSWWIARGLSSLVVAADTHDRLVFMTVATAVMGLGIGAAWWPAHRAARLDPATALRVE